MEVAAAAQEFLLLDDDFHHPHLTFLGSVWKEGDDDGHGTGGICITEKEAGRMFSLTNTRYVTYGGLCVAAAIISQRSAIMAGTLGLVIVGYISLSEYYLQGATGELKPVGV